MRYLMGMMTYSDQQRAIETVKRKYRGCPNCAMQGASIGDIVGLAVLERAIPSGIAPGSQLLPVLPVICQSCGYFTFFAAKEFVELER